MPILAFGCGLNEHSLRGEYWQISLVTQTIHGKQRCLMQDRSRREFESSAAAAAGATVFGSPAVAKAPVDAAAKPGASLPTPYPRPIGPNAMKYIQEVVESGLTGAVAMAERFEQAFAKELGVKHCMATPGCTPALAALAAAFGFQPGDEIIVSPISDYGTIQGLVRENYIPVFADAAPGTVNLSAETIEPCITDRTLAILVVHKTGLICDMDPINELAKKHRLLVYEDACQAVFGQYKGRLAGTLADAAGFSFDSEKTMGADIGGCVATNDDDLARRVRLLGQERGVTETKDGFGRIHSLPGYAYRMPGCTAAICLAQLEIIRDEVARRDKMIRLLTRLLGEIPGIRPLPIPDYMNVYSAWMCSFSIDPEQFRCSADDLRGAGRRRDPRRRNRPILPASGGMHVPAEEGQRKNVPVLHAARLDHTVMAPKPAPRPGTSSRPGSAGRRSARSTPSRTASSCNRSSATWPSGTAGEDSASGEPMAIKRRRTEWYSVLGSGWRIGDGMTFRPTKWVADWGRNDIPSYEVGGGSGTE